MDLRFLFYWCRIKGLWHNGLHWKTRFIENEKFNGTIKIYGWDKSKTATEVANFSLHFEKSQYPTKTIEIEIIEKDTLDEQNWGEFDYDESQLYKPDLYLDSIEKYGMSWFTSNSDLSESDLIYEKDANFFENVYSFKEITLNYFIDEVHDPEFLEEIANKFLETIPKRLGYDAVKSEFYSPTFDTKILPMLKQKDIAGREVGGLIFDKYLGGGRRHRYRSKR